MKINVLSIARYMVVWLLMIGSLHGLNMSVILPIWIAAATLIIVLTFIIWAKEGRSFQPLVPLSLVIIGALAVVVGWVYLTS